MLVKIKKLKENAVVPEYKTSGAACFDFAISDIEMSEDGRFATVGFGVAFEIPEGFEITIKPRSSFCHKGWVMQNSPGSIDSDYRGEIKAKFERIEGEFPYKVGDRVCQGKLERVLIAEFVEVNELNETARNDGGFGHTGIRVQNDISY